MPEDATQRASLAYRKAQAAIWAGQVPTKYTRLLPVIQGRRVLELGAAEGVLSLCLSRERRVDHVTALELRPDRHEEGLRLSAQWRELEYDVDRCTMVCGDILDRLDLLSGMDTLVAVRSIYYLEADAARVLAEAALQGVTRVVLCGNAGRQARHRANPHDDLGRFNRLASSEGMRALLERAGYRITTVMEEGDPIVVGCLPDRA